ncbi:PTS transporter subunit EIIC, partial [Klebsiella pneumoniae]|nr:PTS transporter subunit EIIC [Klebsiella pneumoniae]
VSNIAQGGAALAAARFSKDADFRALASGAGFTALLGITEPALYGVNLKLKKPFYAVLVAGAVGGLFVGIMG